MERRKQYNEKQVEQDLYQYEMGIELGADVEAEKRNHQKEYTTKSILLRISKTTSITTTRATPRETTRTSATTTRIKIVKAGTKKTAPLPIGKQEWFFFMFRNTLRYRPASYALASQGPWPCSRH